MWVSASFDFSAPEHPYLEKIGENYYMFRGDGPWSSHDKILVVEWCLANPEKWNPEGQTTQDRIARKKKRPLVCCYIWRYPEYDDNLLRNTVNPWIHEIGGKENGPDQT